MKKLLPLIFVIILAIFLRFYRLTDNPPSLNWDEISHGYNAYSIIRTGMDEWGAPFPAIFRAYGDYKLPVYIYLTAISVKIFGLTELAVRFTSTVTGVLAVIFTILLVKELFKNYWIAVLSGLILAVSPWHIFLSRPAFEANLASMFLIAGIYFFLVGLRRRWFLPLSLVIFWLSVFTYNSARIFVPLFLVTVVLLYSQKVAGWAKRKKEFILTTIFLIFFALTLVFSLLSWEGQTRFRWVSILDEGAINRINIARTLSSLPSPLPRLVYNKLTYSTVTFLRNYLSNLSPEYLFFKGGTHYQYNIPGRGLMYWIDLPALLLGLYWLMRNMKKNEARFLTAWWLLALIPSAATRDNPHVLRTILVLPVPQILTAVGIWQGLDLVKSALAKKLLLVTYGTVLAFFTISFLANYFGDYRKSYSWAWQYGYKETALLIKNYYREYNKILITKKYGEPHEFLLFYLKWDPEKYRQDPNLVRYFRSDWYWVDSFDKFILINDWEVKNSAKCKMQSEKCLLITSPGNYSEKWRVINTIDFLDGKPAFEILENVQ